MEFRLTYRGPLASNGKPAEKHAIRKALHLQLHELWRTDNHLRRWLDAGRLENTIGIPDHAPPSMAEKIGGNYNIGPFHFVPLVSSEFGLACSLDILFLRRDEIGNIVTHGGDIDNRIKTLFDALRTPKKWEEANKENPSPQELPLFFTLLEDDSLITDFRVEADRLLEPRAMLEPPDYVMLLIRAKTKIINYENAFMDMNFQ